MTIMMLGCGGCIDAAFSPLDISGLVMWGDPAYGLYQERTGASATTPADEDGDPVGTWACRTSGSDVYWTAPSDAARPTFKPAIVNGRPVVRYDGSDDYLAASSLFGGLTAGEVFIVAKANAEAEQGLWHMSGVTLNSNVGQYWPFSDSNIYENWGSSARITAGNPTPSLDSWTLYNVSSASSSYIVRVNGSELYSSGTNTVGFGTTHFLGKQSDSSNRYFPGDIAAWAIYNSVLSTEDRASIEAYFNGRYDL